jgi:hypothetical protein
MVAGLLLHGYGQFLQVNTSPRAGATAVIPAKVPVTLMETVRVFRSFESWNGVASTTESEGQLPTLKGM